VTDRRLLPGETAESVRAEIVAALAEHGVSDVEIVSCTAEKPALVTPDDHPAVRACQRALQAAGLDTETAAVAFGTDAGIFADADVPCVVLGPGSIRQAHTAVEYVPTAEVESMTEIFVRLLEGD
jgi:acetylornithine deacetylase